MTQQTKEDNNKIKELEEKIGILEVKLEKANILLFQVIEEDENENIIVDYETIKKKIHLYFNFNGEVLNCHCWIGF